jgi:hypothetical protein
MKDILTMLGIAAVLGFGYLHLHPEAVAQAQQQTQQSITSTTTAPGEPKPWIKTELGKEVQVKNGKGKDVKMPGNCLQLVPEMVTYVGQHPEVSDKDIPDYVCGWY